MNNIFVQSQQKEILKHIVGFLTIRLNILMTEAHNNALTMRIFLVVIQMIFILLLIKLKTHLKLILLKLLQLIVTAIFHIKLNFIKI